MKEIILQMIMNIPITLFNIICWEKCYNENKKSKKHIIILLAIIMTIITGILNFNLPKGLRLITTFIVLIIINFFYLTRKIKESFLLVVISQLIIWIVEFSFIIVATICIKDNIYIFSESMVGFFVLNMYITIISFLMLKPKIPIKIYNFLTKIIDSVASNESILYMIMIIVIMIVSMLETHMKLPMPIVLTINIIMSLIYIIIIFKFTSVKARYNKINSKYQTSISSLKEHETTIDKYSISTHENKNELMTIRNMSKDKKVINYIDKLIDNKIKDNEKIMSKTYKIPEGGLRATIYTKLCVMDKYKIKYTLDIAKDVKTVDLINMDDDLVVSICRILGIFLDNSIEAVKELKEKKIEIELYLMDNNLYIDITNNFEGTLELKNISNTKYTTKGKGHGYGLLLVKQIIKESNGLLENESIINGNFFTQTLKIKM